MIDKDSLMESNVYEQPYQKEKDYIEELFLTEIYSATDVMVFKGGTAISKFYGSVRFSDDLNFSIAPECVDKNNVAVQLAEVMDRISKEYPLKVMRKKNSSHMITFEFSIRGPLFETLNKYQHLKIEIDKTASVMDKTNAFRKNPPYADLKPYLAMVMSKEEILAEKIVALLFRLNIKARDLYDIYFLMQMGADIEVAMVDKKMKEYHHTFTGAKMLSRMRELNTIWDAELHRLLPEKDFVRFNTAKKYVMERFIAAGLL